MLGLSCMAQGTWQGHPKNNNGGPASPRLAVAAVARYAALWPWSTALCDWA